MSTSDQNEFDLFISYAHSDNRDGWLTAMVDAIIAEHAKFTPTPLRLFFDTSAIDSMNDWEFRILKGLRDSKIMLAVLSPAYFQSEYCRKEWEIYLEQELGQAMPGEAIAPVYIMTHPMFEDHAGDALNEWMLNLKRRQYTDIRDWRVDGPRALEQQDVRERLALMDQQIVERLNRLRKVGSSPTTVPEHNRNFVGRADELRQLRQALALDSGGAMAALHGIGGVGKSALAFEYAHAYADDYPDGRYLVGCEGVTDLREAILKLVPQLGITLTKQEQTNADDGVARVKSFLESKRRTLLVLDNVSDSSLLNPRSCATFLPDTARVHVLATTRLDPDRLRGVKCVALDALPETDALRLLERHRPISGSQESEEWKAALRIANRLGGHSLAVEVVAVFLWQNPDVSYQDYLARLEYEGLVAVDGAAEDEFVQLSRHTEKMIGQLFEPTLGSLTPEELVVVELAALLPADNVAEPWLRQIAVSELPDMQSDPPPGHVHPWRRVIRRLSGLQILLPNEDDRLFRMHRLLQEVVIRRMGENQALRFELIKKLVGERARILWNSWADKDACWEIAPLANFATLRMNVDDPFGAWVANRVSEPLKQLGRFFESRIILREAMLVNEKLFDSNHPDLGTIYCNLAALVERALGDLPTATDLLQKAISIWNLLYKPDAPLLCTGYSNLALLERDMGNLVESRKFLNRAISGWEKASTPNYAALVVAYSNLSNVEGSLANFEASRTLQQRSLTIAREEVFDREQPAIANSYMGLASLELVLADFSAARKLFEKALAIRENQLPGHPGIAKTYAGLASLEREQANYSEVRRLQEKALKIRLEAFDSADHPSLADSYSALASLEQTLANFTVARELHQKSLDIREQIFDSEHSAMAGSYSGIASWEQEMANFSVAREFYESALAIWVKLREPAHPTLAGCYTSLASLHQLFGDRVTARRLQEQALAIRENAFGPDHPKTASSYSSIASILMSEGKQPEARELHDRALEVRKRVYGTEHPTVASSYAAIASWEHWAGNYDTAMDLHERANDIRMHVFGPDHPLIAGGMNGRATVYRSQGDLVKAKQLLEQAITIDLGKYPSDHTSLARDYYALAVVEVDLRQLGAAKPLMRQALNIRRKRLGATHRQTVSIRSWLSRNDPGFNEEESGTA